MKQHLRRPTALSSAALTPDGADLDTEQLSLPRSSPHPRGRRTAPNATALDSIKAGSFTPPSTTAGKAGAQRDPINGQ